MISKQWKPMNPTKTQGFIKGLRESQLKNYEI